MMPRKPRYKRKTTRAPSQEKEHQEQVAFFIQVLSLQFAYPDLQAVFAIPNGGWRAPTTAEKMRAEGQRAGVWDIQIAVPRDGWPGAWIEMKWGSNYLTDSQKEFGALMLERGYRMFIAYNTEQAICFAFDYLGIPRPAQWHQPWPWEPYSFTAGACFAPAGLIFDVPIDQIHGSIGGIEFPFSIDADVNDLIYFPYNGSEVIGRVVEKNDQFVRVDLSALKDHHGQ